jgi:hypothetical protein
MMRYKPLPVPLYPLQISHRLDLGLNLGLSSDRPENSCPFLVTLVSLNNRFGQDSKKLSEKEREKERDRKGN